MTLYFYVKKAAAAAFLYYESKMIADGDIIAKPSMLKLDFVDDDVLKIKYRLISVKSQPCVEGLAAF